MPLNPKNKLRGEKQLKNERVKGGGKEKDGGIENEADGCYCIA